MADFSVTPASEDNHDIGNETQSIQSEMAFVASESGDYEDQKTAFVEEEIPSVELRPSALVLASGPLLGKKIDVPPGGLVIGRATTCDITVGSRKDGVSREHARVYFEDNGLFLKDLESTNGLRVNNVSLRFSPLRPGDLIQIGRTLLKVVAGGQDARYHETMYNKAVRDPLTGLFNRQNLQAMLTGEVKAAVKGRRPLCLMMCDIDHFKRVNDQFGHQAGDEVLRQMGRLVRSGLREADRAFRYGGEEVLVLLPNTDIDSAMAIAERLRKMTEMRRFAFGEVVIPLTVSIGVGQFTNSIEALVGKADAALYAAKNGGRNRVVRATQSTDRIDPSS